MISIRKEQSEDIEAIRKVVESAFGGTEEAILVDRLREAGKALISLVATEDNRVIGHILFSAVTLEADGDNANDAPLAAIGLAPLAVLPEFQNRSVGSLLTRAGLEECRKAGYQCAVVLGHPHYYPRFGFVPSVRYHIKSEFAVSDETFMAMELTDGGLKNRSGIIKYQPEFDGF
jgi:putative acetyltransferase